MLNSAVSAGFILKNFFGGFFMANTLSNTHRVLDRKIKDLELYSPHKSQLIKTLKIKKLGIKDKMRQVVDEQIDKFIAQEKEKRYKDMLHTIQREKRRKKVERATKKRKVQQYAERLDKIPLSGLY
tara:strand:- start:243 stop:620 length:378 start_codon:yes stop_codon:yes gene_type:complete